jgi:hypothetical protein
MALIETIPVKEDYRRKLAQQLLREGMSAEPVLHWAQGLGRMGQAALGGYQMYQADQRDKETEAGNNAALIAALGGGVPAPTAQPAPQQPAARPPAPVSSVTPSAGAVPAALMGERPGGPVMPSAKVWGDKEAEAAGLYEQPTKTAALSPMVPTPVKTEAIAPTAAPAVPAPTDTQMADAKAKIAAMLASDNPQMRKLGQGMAQSLLVNQLQGDKPTDDIREFKYGQQNPEFNKWMLEKKRAGAINNNVVIDQKGELEFSKTAGKKQAERFDELASDGQTAKQMISDVQTLTELGKTIGTGKGAEAKAALGPYAEALGIKIEGLNEIQAFEAIVNRVAPSLRVKGSGAQSDFELKNFLKSLPNLGNTPEGNAIAAKTLEGLYQNKVAAADIAAKALAREIKPAEAEKMLRELPDHMAEYREYLKKGNSRTAAPKGVDPAALEEARRRGLVK